MTTRKELSLSGQKFMHHWEGYRSKAYLDTGGVWTIGYGTTRINGTPVTKGMTCTKKEAAEWFKKDVDWCEDAVNDFVKVPLNQNQFDALVSFTYNVGERAFRTSTLLRKLNEQDYIEAANQLLRWRYDNGTEIQGLLNRRIAEKELFETAFEEEDIVSILKDYLGRYNVPDSVILEINDRIEAIS